jgi:hypothetical protein
MATVKQIKVKQKQNDQKIKNLTKALAEAKKKKVSLGADLKKAVAAESKKVVAKKKPAKKKAVAKKKK